MAPISSLRPRPASCTPVLPSASALRAAARSASGDAIRPARRRAANTMAPISAAAVTSATTLAIVAAVSPRSAASAAAASTSSRRAWSCGSRFVRRVSASAVRVRASAEAAA